MRCKLKKKKTKEERKTSGGDEKQPDQSVPRRLCCVGGDPEWTLVGAGIARRRPPTRKMLEGCWRDARDMREACARHAPWMCRKVAAWACHVDWPHPTAQPTVAEVHFSRERPVGPESCTWQHSQHGRGSNNNEKKKSLAGHPRDPTAASLAIRDNGKGRATCTQNNIARKRALTIEALSPTPTHASTYLQGRIWIQTPFAACTLCPQGRKRILAFPQVLPCHCKH